MEVVIRHNRNEKNIFKNQSGPVWTIISAVNVLELTNSSWFYQVLNFRPGSRSKTINVELLLWPCYSRLNFIRLGSVKKSRSDKKSAAIDNLNRKDYCGCYRYVFSRDLPTLGVAKKV